MQLSTSDSSGLRNFTRFLTNTNTTTYTNADLDASLNRYYHLIVNEILQSMDDWDFQADYATTNLVASQQEYTVPTDLIKLKRVEVSYDGSNWYPCSPMDLNQRSGASDSTTINSDFSTSSPAFDLMDNSLFLYPIPTANSTGGLKMWYEKEADELSGDTDEPNFQKAYHKLLSFGAAKDWLTKYITKEGNSDKRNIISGDYKDLLESMKEFYNTKNQDRDYVILPSVTDYDYDPNR
jgi:hypothetical protein